MSALSDIHYEILVRFNQKTELFCFKDRFFCLSRANIT
ncbi:unnamed protein product [Arabidopsis halleri]